MRNHYPISLLTLVFLFLAPSLFSKDQASSSEVLLLLDRAALYENDADTVLAFMQDMSQKYGSILHVEEGYEEVEFQANWAKYGLIVFIGEKSLTQLAPHIQENLKNYLLNKEDSKHSAMLGIFFQEDRAKSSVRGTWYDKLKKEMMEVQPEQETLSLKFSAIEQNTFSKSQPMAYHHIFPSLLPGDSLAGSRVFFSYMAGAQDAFSHRKAGVLNNHLLQRHLENAWSWSLGEAASQMKKTEILSLALNAQGNQVLFNWTDSLPADACEYLLQSSEDGLNWKIIHTRTTREERKEKYEYLDKDIGKGDHVFRILKREANKEDLYSIPVILSVSNQSPDIELFPNPVRDVLFMNIASAKTEQTEISIMGSVLAQPLWKSTLYGEFLSQKLPVVVSSLALDCTMFVLKQKILQPGKHLLSMTSSRKSRRIYTREL